MTSQTAVGATAPGVGVTPLYVPILKSKSAEWTALRHVQTKDRMLPLIEVTPPPVRKSVLTAEGWAREVVKDATRSWPRRALAIDSRPSTLGDSAVGGTTLYEFVAADSVKTAGPLLVPVIGTTDTPAHYAGASALHARDGAGMLLRLEEDVVARAAVDAGAGLTRQIAAVLSAVAIHPREVDVVIDMGAVGQSATTHANSLASCLPHLPHAPQWRSIAVAGSSAPEQSAVANFTQFVAPRVEWSVWNQLRASKPPPPPLGFGDYAGFAASMPQGVARTRHPALRYTHDSVVEIVRREAAAGAGFGPAVRGVTAHVTSQTWFSGSGFSWGDGQIEAITRGAVSTGGATQWRMYAVNHHLEVVAAQLASYRGP